MKPDGTIAPATSPSRSISEILPDSASKSFSLVLAHRCHDEGRSPAALAKSRLELRHQRIAGTDHLVDPL
jgi:hypothetical protein